MLNQPWWRVFDIANNRNMEENGTSVDSEVAIGKVCTGDVQTVPVMCITVDGGVQDAKTQL